MLRPASLYAPQTRRAGQRNAAQCEHSALPAEHPDAARELFGESRLPTLVQYDRARASFEGAMERCCFSDNGVHGALHIAIPGPHRLQEMLAFLEAIA